MNRLPSAVEECEEEAGASSPNSTVSSVSLKRSEREEHEMERACSRGISDEEDGDTSRKKLRLSKDQSAILEESFKEHNTLNPVSSQSFLLLLFFLLNDFSRQLHINERSKLKKEKFHLLLLLLFGVLVVFC